METMVLPPTAGSSMDQVRPASGGIGGIGKDKDSKLFWSDERVEQWNPKFQVPNYKQISNSNIQLPKHKKGLDFWILVIVIYLFFVICDLEFLSILLSITPSETRREERFGFFPFSSSWYGVFHKDG